MKKQILLGILAIGLFSQTAHAQDLLASQDGDFSTNPGSGNPSAEVTSLGGGSFEYVNNSGTVTDVGGTGDWTFANGSSVSKSAIYLVNTSSAYSESWIPQAAPSNTNGYVVQLDTISNPGTWTTGNAVYQTVAVTAGTTYALTFSINTEHNTPGFTKNQLSLADVMVTNATITNSTGSFGTVSTSGTVSSSGGTDLNALTYGDVTGYQYSVDTTLDVGTGGDATTWETYTLDFTATSNSIQIALADDPGATDDSNSNISLEDISLTAVPEPHQWAIIMLLGMAGLVVARKLRARVTPRLATI